MILLPPLGAPPVDGVAVDVLEVGDDEGAALGELDGRGDRDGVGVDAAGEVADRRVQGIGAEFAAVVAYRRLLICFGYDLSAAAGIRSGEDRQIGCGFGYRLP